MAHFALFPDLRDAGAFWHKGVVNHISGGWQNPYDDIFAYLPTPKSR